MNDISSKLSSTVLSRYLRLEIHPILLKSERSAELQLLEHLWAYEKLFETGINRANES